MSDGFAGSNIHRRKLLKMAACAPALSPLIGCQTLADDVSSIAPAAAGGVGAASQVELTKSVSLVIRKPGQSKEDFNQAWLGVHGPGARQIPDLHGFILGEVVPDPARAGSAAVDGVALDGITESWQPPGVSRGEQAKTNPYVRAWLDTGPSYIGSLNIYVTREHVFVPPKRGGLKVMTLISRKPGVSHEDFVKHCLEVHGPLARDVPGLGGYVLSEIIRNPKMPGIPDIPELGEIDIIGTSWLPTDPDQRTPNSPQRSAWLADGGANFGSFKRYTMVEHVFVDPPN